MSDQIDAVPAPESSVGPAEEPGARAAPAPVRLADYRVPDYLVDTVDLVFDLEDRATLVRARLAMRRNPAAAPGGATLRLDGEALELLSVTLDGERLGDNRYSLDPKGLTLAPVPDTFTLEIETRIDPASNLELTGLYKSGGNFCTQCEAEGFRRITFFPDRPDILARYTVTIRADETRYPVLLSNGDPVASGRLEGGRHWVTWHDPHPKPAYLFALVAGELVAVRDRFTTKSGRTVELGLWVRAGDENRTGHAMRALKAAMRWDETVYGLEYDLGTFNIVAVSDFNMGAMENKGLNIFNAKYVLAAPETATDADYQGVETVIAHEYFHNWTGNRITCRDWFQLSLKEGLTVFRDQQFAADQGSAAVKRILDVRRLRASQFPEDDGPLAHPVRPESYIEINNFYTPTVYQKGAEVVRMIHTLLGPGGFRAGMDLYVQRHDNQAVTVEDFLAAMADATGVDLGHFKRWYCQAGTPSLETEDGYDPATQRYTLCVRQSGRAGSDGAAPEPLSIPLAMGLISAAGEELPTRLEGEAAPLAGTRVLQVTSSEARFVFVDVPSRPVPSLLRGFSAPVRLKPLALSQLRFLAVHDGDAFARWEAGQQMAATLLFEMIAAWRRGDRLTLDPDLVRLVEATLEDVLSGAETDTAFAAERIILPSEAFLSDQMQVIDVEAIHAAREFAMAELGRRLGPLLRECYQHLADLGSGSGARRTDAAAIGARALRNLALAYLTATGEPGAIELAQAQFAAAGNMTDTLAALSALSDLDCPERGAALSQFYETWKSDELVTDKWFAIQALSSLPETLDTVRVLIQHPAFDMANPNRVRALVGSFAMANALRFHDGSGAGYQFLADQVLALDGFNAQMAARLVVPLGMWRRHDAKRQLLMKRALERILAASSLSKGTFEMASRSLS